jgi:hypothetical protein
LNVAVEAPAGIVTEGGVVAAGRLLEIVTATPPVGAAEFNVSVAVEFAPPTTAVGLRLKPTSEGGAIVRTAFAVTDARAAVMVADVGVDTGWVETVNVALVAPAGIVTLAGVVALWLLLDRPTAIPPIGAGKLIETVPVELRPPATLVGFRDRRARESEFTVSVAESVTLPKVAEILTVAVFETLVVEMAKFALSAPPGIVTEGGVFAVAGLLLVKVTFAPLAGAGALRVTVPVDP